MNDKSMVPFVGEEEEAKKNPGGWVYRIAGDFKDGQDVPPEAIVGAWSVDANGRITGEFKANPNYDSRHWPMPKQVDDHQTGSGKAPG